MRHCLGWLVKKTPFSKHRCCEALSGLAGEENTNRTEVSKHRVLRIQMLALYSCEALSGLADHLCKLALLNFQIYTETVQWSLHRQSYLLTTKLTSGLCAYPTNTDNLTCSHQNWPVVCMLTPPIQTILLAHIKTDQWSVCLPHQYRQSYLLTSKLTSGLYAYPTNTDNPTCSHQNWPVVSAPIPTNTDNPTCSHQNWPVVSMLTPTNTDNPTCSHQNWPVVCMLTPPIQTILLAHIKTDQWSVCLPPPIQTILLAHICIRNVTACNYPRMTETDLLPFSRQGTWPCLLIHIYILQWWK